MKKDAQKDPAVYPDALRARVLTNQVLPFSSSGLIGNSIACMFVTAYVACRVILVNSMFRGHSEEFDKSNLTYCIFLALYVGQSIVFRSLHRW